MNATTGNNDMVYRSICPMPNRSNIRTKSTKNQLKKVRGLKPHSREHAIARASAAILALPGGGGTNRVYFPDPQTVDCALRTDSFLFWIFWICSFVVDD